MAGQGVLTCPSCGGAVSPPLGARRIKCAYCDESYFYAGDDFLPRLALEPKVSDSEVKDSILKSFRGLMVPGDLSRRALLLDNRRAYIPFYFLVGKRGGVLKSTSVKRNWRPPSHIDRMADLSGDPALRGMTRHRDEGEAVTDSRVVLGNFQFLYSAASLDEWNFEDMDVKDLILERLEEARPVLLSELVAGGEVLDLSKPLDKIVELGVGTFESKGGALNVLELHAVVVYLPVRIATFRYGRTLFKVVVEETGGKVLSADLPFRRSWAFMAGVGIIAVMGLFTGQFARFMAGAVSSGGINQRDFSGVLHILIVLALIFGPLGLAGINAAWLFFRTPFMVRITPKGSILKDALDTPPSPINPIGRWLKQAVEGYSREQGV